MVSEVEVSYLDLRDFLEQRYKAGDLVVAVVPRKLEGGGYAYYGTHYAVFYVPAVAR